MRLKRKPLFAERFKIAKANSWSSSAWFAIKLAVLFAPSTLLGMVIYPIFRWLVAATVGFVLLWWNLGVWIFYTIVILIAGLAGFIQVLPEDDSQK